MRQACKAHQNVLLQLIAGSLMLLTNPLEAGAGLTAQLQTTLYCCSWQILVKQVDDVVWGSSGVLAGSGTVL